MNGIWRIGHTNGFRAAVTIARSLGAGLGSFTKRTVTENNTVFREETESSERLDASKMTTDAESGRDMAKMDDAERLARAVLFFHRGGLWTKADQEIWLALTGKSEPGIRALCDFAREIIGKREFQALSEAALATAWDNEADKEYDG